MHAFDHALVLLLVAVQPVVAVLGIRRVLAAGAAVDRVLLYNRTLLMQWGSLGVLAAGWLLLGRSAASLGIVAPGGRGFLAGAAFVLLLIGFLVYSLRSARSLSDAERAKQVSSLGHLVHFLPHTRRDYRRFALLSVTAGIVEEIVYRGFLLWYLALHMPTWAAVAVSSAVFGVGHGYQGPRAALYTGLAGLAFAILYLVSGSIWLPIVAHAAVDLLQGALIFEILRHRPEASRAQPAEPR